MVPSSLKVILLLINLGCNVFALPYRAFSSRSVPGRIRSSAVPENMKEYLSYYLENQKRFSPHPYGIPEYEPTYQTGYLSRRPQIDPETIASILPYISQTEANDYSYDDYQNEPLNSYTDNDGTWYDDSVPPVFDSRDKNNEQAALLQLYLDHLAGKYSLDDLKTLERQAALQDNAENQLQALLPQQKKLSLPLLMPRHSTKLNIARQGQKEEPLMIPAASVRKPMFARLTNSKKSLSSSSTQAPALSSEKVEKTLKSRDELSSTMQPAIKSAYDAFKTYLDQERALRQTNDEKYHSPQKRFVADPQSLTEQLAGLHKTIT